MGMTELTVDVAVKGEFMLVSCFIEVKLLVMETMV